MDLFENAQKDYLKQNAPLAARMRPDKLEDFIGQEKVIGPKSPLRIALKQQQLFSMVFCGPPASGKTTLARLVASFTKGEFIQLSAVSEGVKAVKQVIKEAEERLSFYHRQTILFVDEIHRFSKSQQDVLLPAIEEGKIVFIGATTENPFFSLNTALLSRLKIFFFEALSSDDIEKILNKALNDPTKGLKNYQVEISSEVLPALALSVNGDARMALNFLETLVLNGKSLEQKIDLAMLESFLDRKVIAYDRQGDQHYDVISAFIKSIRGSDVDAALHYLARMLEAGENLDFISRRLLILAAEDVGMADPQALILVQAAAEALRQVGMPEGRIILAEAVIYLAEAPKSNSALTAIDAALADVRQLELGQVPEHLQDRHGPGLAKKKKYLYPHQYRDHWVRQDYLPDKIKNRSYYVRGDSPREKKAETYWQRIKKS